MPPSILEEIKKVIAGLQTAISTLAQQQAAHQANCPVKTPSQAQNSLATPFSDPTATQSASQPQIVVSQTFPTMVIKWARAIQQWEGGPDKTNPGDLKYSTFTASLGAMPGIAAKDGGHLARFKSYEAGFTALCHFLTLGCHDSLASYHSARTLGAFLTVYGGNPPQGYLNGIAHDMGVALDVDIKTFL